MDLLKEIPSKECTIQVYRYNGKYILKIGKDNLEQVFKIGETDVFGIEDVEKMITQELIINSIQRFEGMKKEFDLVLNLKNTNT